MSNCSYLSGRSTAIILHRATQAWLCCETATNARFNIMFILGRYCVICGTVGVALEHTAAPIGKTNPLPRSARESDNIKRALWSSRSSVYFTSTVMRRQFMMIFKTTIVLIRPVFTSFISTESIIEYVSSLCDCKSQYTAQGTK